MTSRDESHLVSLPYTYTVVDFKGGKTQTLGLRNFSRNFVWTGADRPGFRSVIANQQDATNPYSAFKWQLHRSASFIEAEWRIVIFADGKWWDSIVSEQAFGSGFLAYFPSVPDAVFNSVGALNAAKSKFISRARHAMSPFKGGVFLGELRETIHLVRHPAMALRRSLSDHLSRLKKARSGFKRSSRARKEKFLSGTWLEYSFGVKPLIQDIQDGAEALAKFIVSTQPTESVSGKGGRSQTSDFIHYSNQGLERMRCGFDTYRELSTTYQIKGAVLLRPRSDAGAFNTNFGLNLQEFVPTVWELIPYSFLVDYFTNIGAIIEAATFISANLVYTVQTQKTTERIFISELKSEGSPYPGTVGSVSGGKGKLEAMRLVRLIPPTLVPQFSWSYPRLGSTKWTNIAALGAQHSKLIPF